MTERPYPWRDGAPLEEHTKRKHKVLAEYFSEYIKVRCIPRSTRFKLTVVDGFAGGGRYSCGTRGSPILFIEELERAVHEINIWRGSQNLANIDIECNLIFNDADRDTLELLKERCTPVVAAAKATQPRLHLNVSYMQEPFEQAYPKIKELVAASGHKNVLYNLDQCGHTHVHIDTLRDIMSTAPSVEIFYTVMIGAFLAYLSSTKSNLLASQLRPFGFNPDELKSPDKILNKKQFLGAAERIVFEFLQGCANFVSPFSIQNPDGWRYWLMHFARSYRARQVYNDILHDNSSSQAHFGRSGLNMLSYNPEHEGSLYLFDQHDRARARYELVDDIPRVLEKAAQRTLKVETFYEAAYNTTPAHMVDIHKAIFDNSDLEVRTSTGSLRRTHSTITADDFLVLREQITISSALLGPRTTKGQKLK